MRAQEFIGAGIFAVKIIAEAKEEKCEYCKEIATQQLIWADGRAYVPICDKHEAKARKDINDKNGEWAEIVGAKPL